MEKQRPGRALRVALLPAGLAIASLLPAFGLAEPTSGPLAAVFPPWWSSARVLEAAASAGRIVGVGAAPFVVIVAAEPGGRPDHDSLRLHAAGAWLLLDPQYLGGCGTSLPLKDA